MCIQLVRRIISQFAAFLRDQVADTTFVGKNLSPLIAVSLFSGLIFAFAFAGCDKKRGEAVVIEKEHIAAKEIPKTPTNEPTAGSPEATPEVSERPIGPDEITLGPYVMKKEVRGTSRDPRAIADEQWIVSVRMIADGRRFNVQTDQPKWDKLKEGDRVQVTYRVGKYTDTVWGSEID